jgi:hypothetical protein
MSIRKTSMVLGLLSGLVFGQGGVACSSSGDDGADVPLWDLPELSAEEGVSFRIPAFEVPPGREEQSCYFVQVPDVSDGKDMWVDHVKLAMNPGSHHMNVFRVRTIINMGPESGAPVKLGAYDATVVVGHDDYTQNPCWDSANWADWPLVTNTQVAEEGRPYTDWQLPDDVAFRLTPGEWLMLQTHYVNTTDQPTPLDGRVGINLYRSSNPDPQEMGTLFATQQNIRICRSNPDVTFSGTCRFPGPVNVTAANGHFHKRGEEFRMYTWNGTSVSHPLDDAQFYLSQAWDHPPMTTNIERPVGQGGGIWWDCQYQWREPLEGCDLVDQKDPEKQGDCCYTFGGNTDVGEHCNVFLYYYPRADNTDIFCN